MLLFKNTEHQTAEAEKSGKEREEEKTIRKNGVGSLESNNRERERERGIRRQRDSLKDPIFYFLGYVEALAFTVFVFVAVFFLNYI